MFSLFVAPFLMLLSAFGLYFSPPQPPPTLPPVPVKIADETRASTSTRTEKAAATSREKSAKPSSTKTTLPESSAAQSAPATPVREPTPPPQPPVHRTLLELLEDATNNERALRGLAPLELDAELSRIAEAHSADMLLHEYFSHESLEGCSVSCRADKAQYAWRAIGENIYFTEGYTLADAAYAEKVVSGWMASSGHRANILSESYTHLGIGIAQSEGTVYTTAIYARPR